MTTTTTYTRAALFIMPLLYVCAQYSDSDVDQGPTQGTSTDCEPTPKVDKLEKSFIDGFLVKRLKDIEAEFRKRMAELRKMEQSQRR